DAVTERPTALNVGELDAFVPILEAAGALARDGEAFVADLSKAGVDRLLGGGRTSRAWKVNVGYASKHAREKVTVVTPEPAKGTAPAAPPKRAA
ncbi:MAG TPA: uL15m family ribosomal protein, partial [Thermoplasmata archaeon]|nr:uL15m family ribosomal protein [Thermoplasmata archaeon]